MIRAYESTVATRWELHVLGLPGAGSIIFCNTPEELLAAVERTMIHHAYGRAGDVVRIERVVQGHVYYE